MAEVRTPICEFGWKAPDFCLSGVDGQDYCLKDVRGVNGPLIMFLSNHCPYVRAIITRIVRDVTELADYGIRSIAIMPNDTERYPADSLENMRNFSHENKFNFPYVIDFEQSVARAYNAVCTPDFFGFDSECSLQYRVRLDQSRLEIEKDAPRELFEAMKQISKGYDGPKEQFPSMGCSIKWTNEN